MSAAVAAGISAAAPIIAIAAAVVLAAEGTRRVVNWLTGRETTWADIGETLRQILIISGLGWKLIFEKITGFPRTIGEAIKEPVSKAALGVINGIKAVFTTMANAFKAGFQSFATALSSAFAKLASAIGLKTSTKSAGAKVGGMASGGYLASKGLFMGAEEGREFVLSNPTTRTAENVLGGQLTQQRLIQALAGGRGAVTINDSRRFDAEISPRTRRQIREETLRDVYTILGTVGG
jgi:hypothetical protein